MLVELKMPYKDREKRLESHRRTNAKRRLNPEVRAKENAQVRAWGKAHPERYRTKRLKKNGWTLEMFSITLVEQGNVCALCRLPFTKENPPVADHKHVVPPEPRGILCNGCNAAIGLLRESPETCRAAAEYLEAWA